MWCGQPWLIYATHRLNSSFESLRKKSSPYCIAFCSPDIADSFRSSSSLTVQTCWGRLNPMTRRLSMTMRKKEKESIPGSDSIIIPGQSALAIQYHVREWITKRNTRYGPHSQPLRLQCSGSSVDLSCSITALSSTTNAMKLNTIGASYLSWLQQTEFSKLVALRDVGAVRPPKTTCTSEDSLQNLDRTHLRRPWSPAHETTFFPRVAC